jgi:hypothetical protein
MCGGCLEEGCIHVREKDTQTDRSKSKCFFGKIHNLEKTCPVENPPPPKYFHLANPSVLTDALLLWRDNLDEMTTQPAEPEWPLFIPEISDITETTSRIDVREDEGDWYNPKFKSIAWDMTGYLFDKIQGAPWVRKPNALGDKDWSLILNSESSSIKNILLIDRLPDRLAMQTPPTAIMVAYMNRLFSYHSNMFDYNNSQTPWLVFHGYPSYIDWPPAWHWNLGIRMLASLVEYLTSQGEGIMGPKSNAWSPDLSSEQTGELRLPFVNQEGLDKLLWNPAKEAGAPTSMDWDTMPGIIPFIPGADSNQLAWFAKQVVTMGFTTVAIDAVNSIAHENFKKIPEAVSVLRNVGVKHVMIYGPWPLHPPTKYIPRNHVSYIPTASHMDLINSPPRYWYPRRKEEKEWKKQPSYRRTSLKQISFYDWMDLCKCPACSAAVNFESDPRSIWRWGHFLYAGYQWMKDKKGGTNLDSEDTKKFRLLYQGPSYMVYRKCLHYPPEYRWKGIDDIIESLVFDETEMKVVFPDKKELPSSMIQWTWMDELHEWAEGFPRLEE